MSAESATGVTVSIEVAVPPEAAFRVFTDEIDRWWLSGPKHRFNPPWNGTIRLEPRVGGHLVEAYADGSVFVIGRVHACVPGERLSFDWRLPSFGQDERTEVEVRFEASTRGTRVTIRHQGWNALRTDHPARHGLAGPDLEWAKARLWAQNLGALRAHVAQSHAIGGN